MNQLNGRYLEDFAVEQTFGSRRPRIEGEPAFAFAAEFDPQPFHLDEAAARRSIFGGLTASGWHTTAVTMRLLIKGELQPASGFVGVGLDECHWPRLVCPGDELRVECDVLEVATVKIAFEAGPDQHQNGHPNQDDEAVLATCYEKQARTARARSRPKSPENSSKSTPAPRIRAAILSVIIFAISPLAIVKGYRKITPSGLKFRFPAAPFTGPLKSPVKWS
jgi:acyl dehydratase